MTQASPYFFPDKIIIEYFNNKILQEFEICHFFVRMRLGKFNTLTITVYGQSYRTQIYRE